MFMIGMGSRMFHGVQMASSFYPTFGGFLAGLIYSFVVGYFIGAVFVLIYNNIGKK